MLINLQIITRQQFFLPYNYYTTKEANTTSKKIRMFYYVTTHIFGDTSFNYIYQPYAHPLVLLNCILLHQKVLRSYVEKTSSKIRIKIAFHLTFTKCHIPDTFITIMYL